MTDRRSRVGELKIVRYRIARLGTLLAILIAAFSQEAGAQEDPQPPSGQESTASSSTSRDSAQEPELDQATTSTLETGPTADQHNRIVALRWGHLSAFSVDTFYAHDSNYKNSPNNPQAADAVATRIVASYSVGNEREGLDVQYRPDVLLSQKTQDYQFGASLVNLHLLRPIGESWTFTLRDSFAYEPDFALFSTPTVSLNSTGGVTQQSFLPNGTTALRNSLSGSFSYRLARHDHLNFHLQDNYAELSNNPHSVKLSGIFYGSANTAGGGVSWTHSVGPSHEFGVGYNYDREILNGFGNQSQYHSILFTYRQRIRRTVLLQASGGPSFHVYGNGVPNQNTFVGSAEITKSFHQSSLAFLYSRGYEFTGILNSYHDRYDAFYIRVFRNILGVEVGASYTNTQSTKFTGRLAFARVSYYLNPRWTLLASFTNSAFSGVTEPYVGRNFITIGAQWSYGGHRGLQRQ
jgi:hypothetical protein